SLIPLLAFFYHLPLPPLFPNHLDAMRIAAGPRSCITSHHWSSLDQSLTPIHSEYSSLNQSHHTSLTSSIHYPSTHSRTSFILANNLTLILLLTLSVHQSQDTSLKTCTSINFSSTRPLTHIRIVVELIHSL
ncbi:unnamed protein product, partial [Ectocarpus sp. 13 AM-2016]